LTNPRIIFTIGATAKDKGVHPMNTETTGLFKKVLGLAEKDRIILTGLLIESLDEERDTEAETLWQAEVARRLEELDSGRIQALSWEEVQSRLQQKDNDSQEN
jgi:putative addiction module component (TIGR02574 family)